MAAVPQQQRTAPCLTDLPIEVFFEILTRLDIRYAARTSAVCRAWRKRWRHLGTLVFHARAVGDADLTSVAQSVLLRHQGQVRKFMLVGSAASLPSTSTWRIDDLLIHVLHKRHALQALCLWAPSYKVHSSIFSCATLVKLNLKGCLLPNPNLEFTGFPNLKELYLFYTRNLKPLMNSRQLEALGALICGSPSLVILDLIVEPDLPDLMLKVSAPCLRDLGIQSFSTDWMVEYQSPFPVISSVKLRLPVFQYAQEGGSKLLHVFQSISLVKKLELLDASGLNNFQDMMPLNIPVTFEKLQYLSIEADLGCAPHLIFTLHLLRCGPNIRQLQIKRSTSRTHLHHQFQANQEFLNIHGYGDLFSHMRFIKLIDVDLSFSELDFIRLVLSKAPTLEKLSIVHRVRDESSRLRACIEIMKFKRASPLAQIEYKTSST